MFKAILVVALTVLNAHATAAVGTPEWRAQEYDRLTHVLERQLDMPWRKRAIARSETVQTRALNSVLQKLTNAEVALMNRFSQISATEERRSLFEQEAATWGSIYQAASAAFAYERLRCPKGSFQAQGACLISRPYAMYVLPKLSRTIHSGWGTPSTYAREVQSFADMIGPVETLAPSEIAMVTAYPLEVLPTNARNVDVIRVVSKADVVTGGSPATVVYINDLRQGMTRDEYIAGSTAPQPSALHADQL